MGPLYPLPLPGEPLIMQCGNIMILILDICPGESTTSLKQQRHQRSTGGMTTRRATHAGSWYLSDGKALGKELEEWLKSAAAKVRSIN